MALRENSDLHHRRTALLFNSAHITADCLTSGPRGHLRLHNFYGPKRGNYTRNISTESILSTNWKPSCHAAMHIIIRSITLKSGEEVAMHWQANSNNSLITSLLVVVVLKTTQAKDNNQWLASNFPHCSWLQHHHSALDARQHTCEGFRTSTPAQSHPNLCGALLRLLPATSVFEPIDRESPFGSISVISVNGWHELFKPHNYRCNILRQLLFHIRRGGVGMYV
jgi:hypothetical protein